MLKTKAKNQAQPRVADCNRAAHDAMEKLQIEKKSFHFTSFNFSAVAVNVWIVDESSWHLSLQVSQTNFQRQQNETKNRNGNKKLATMMVMRKKCLLALSECKSVEARRIIESEGKQERCYRCCCCCASFEVPNCKWETMSEGWNQRMT